MLRQALLLSQFYRWRNWVGGPEILSNLSNKGSPEYFKLYSLTSEPAHVITVLYWGSERLSYLYKTMQFKTGRAVIETKVWLSRKLLPFLLYFTASKDCQDNDFFHYNFTKDSSSEKN